MFLDYISKTDTQTARQLAFDIFEKIQTEITDPGQLAVAAISEVGAVK